MLKSSGAMAAATMTSRVLGMVREMVYARFMGTSRVASRTPSVIVPVLSQQMVETRPIFSTAIARRTTSKFLPSVLRCFDLHVVIAKPAQEGTPPNLERIYDGLLTGECGVARHGPQISFRFRFHAGSIQRSTSADSSPGTNVGVCSSSTT